MPHLLFVFLDGVGLGAASADNPFSTTTLPALEGLAGGQAWTDALSAVDASRHLVRPIDATLGVDGLPQSGTGQATLFTGVNCAEIVGRHFGPFPHSSTHDVLATNSLFHRLQTALLPASAVRASSSEEGAETSAEASSSHGAPTSNSETVSAFANAYPPRFFEMAEGRGRWTVTTRACKAAGVPVRGLDELRRGRALTADLTGAAWRDQLDLDVPLSNAGEAGERLARLSQDYAFTLFEYFLTDKLGHGRLDVAPSDLLTQLDAFFGAVVDRLDPATTSLVVTSDHGNLERMDLKTHTRHPVPLLVRGWAAPFFQSVTDLTGVTPAIVEALRTART